VSVVVLKKGLLDTIQDKGRYAYQHYGINPGGAMDIVAARIANMLVDNDDNEPVVEMHFPAASFMFLRCCVIAISGADFEPEIDGKLVPINTTIFVTENSILSFKRCNEGARAYLALHGKWNIEIWLNSYSTNIKALAGGYKGRALMKNDVIEVNHPRINITGNLKSALVLPVSADSTQFSLPGKTIRVVRNSEFKWLSKKSRQELESNSFAISLKSDRMGYHLKGSVLKSEVNEQLLSSAVTRGTIQLLPSGEMIILMADHQTTGGYPKIANVISADLPKLAQMKPYDSIEFKIVELEEAEDAYIKQQQQLNMIEEKIKQELTNILANESY
jgi:antagonist of KipI